MSQPARRPMPPPPPAAGAFEDTGRFRIEERPRPETLLPPAGERAELLSLDEIGAVLESSPSLPEAMSPASTPLASGIFGKAEGNPQEVQGLAPLEPYYRGTELLSERAELEIQDLSLQDNNPFLPSSLVPPAREPSSAVARGLRVAAVAAIAGAAAVFGFYARPTTPAPAARPHRAADAVTLARPIPQAELPAASAPVDNAVPVAPAPAASVSPLVAAHAKAPNSVPATQAVKAAPSATRAAAVSSAQTAAASPGEQPIAVLPVRDTQPLPAPAAKAGEVPAIERGETEEPAAVGAASGESSDVTAALPELPTREEVVAALEQIRGSVEECAGQKHGVANADISIANSGRVSRVLIDGVFQGTPEGSCMARAIRTAHVARFSEPSLKVSYPFAL